jgi:hypothetical protein
MHLGVLGGGFSVPILKEFASLSRDLRALQSLLGVGLGVHVLKELLNLLISGPHDGGARANLERSRDEKISWKSEQPPFES